RRTTASRARGVYELRHLPERRSAGKRDLHIVRQNNRQLVLRHGYDAVIRTIDHRNRRAPIALPADAPVTQLGRDRLFTEPMLLGLLRHLGDSFFVTKPVEFAGVDKQAVRLGVRQFVWA